MGIKGFSKAFNFTRIVKLKDLKRQRLAIDAMTELYRSSLGAKYVTALTDHQGNPTLYISVILQNIFKFYVNYIDSTWTFDHNQNKDQVFHNTLKLGELEKRSKKQGLASEKINKLKEEAMFSDDELDDGLDGESKTAITKDNISNNSLGLTEEDADELLQSIDLDNELDNGPDLDDEKSSLSSKRANLSKKSANALATKSTGLSKKPSAERKVQIKQQIDALEKQTFKVNTQMINDIKFILDCLNIKWVEAPAGFEGEAIAAYLNATGVVDAVYSGDTDPIAFGAPNLLRLNPKDKQIYEYTQEDVLQQITDANDEIEEPDLDDFLKAAVALGTDMAEKTTGVGPKTVLKKLHNIKLTKSQKEAIEHFKKQPRSEDIVIHNSDKTPFVECRMEELITWLVTVKRFKDSIWRPRFETATARTAVTSTKSSTAKSTKKLASSAKSTVIKSTLTTKSKASNEQRGKKNDNSINQKPLIRQFKPVELKTNNTGSKTNNTGSKTNNTGSKTNNTGSKTNNTGSKTNNTGSKTNNTGSKTNKITGGKTSLQSIKKSSAIVDEYNYDDEEDESE